MKNFIILLILSAFVSITNAQKRIVVDADGSGNYKTVQEAINAVPDNSTAITEIFIKKGVYKQRLVLPISKTNVTLIGEDVNNTVLTFDNYASKPDSSGKAFGTSGSASFYVYGAGFTAKNITFENSSGPVGQALAIYVAGDKSCFLNCRFLGCQDTLYTHGKGSRQFYKSCYIEGTTDFIFGAGTCLFTDCEIYCKKGGSYITAASTLDTTAYGYVFIKCKIKGSAPDNSYTLGRPWRPYAKVVYLNCDLGAMIKPAGWDNWRNPENEKTAYYAEYKSKGPGSNSEQRVGWSHQLTDAEAALYRPDVILKGWKPQTK